MNNLKRNWRDLLVSAIKSRGLTEASMVAKDAYAVMTTPERRSALISLLEAEAEREMRQHVRSVERSAEIARINSESARFKAALERRHKRPFETLEQANDYDDQVWIEAIDAKRREQEERRKILFDEISTRIKMAWSTELLAQEFALGDGTLTTWAMATIEQHEQRINMLAQNIRGNGVAIQRHEAAVIKIMEARAETLAEATADEETP